MANYEKWFTKAMSARAFKRGPTDGTSFYPRTFGANGAVTAEHYLAADAGLDVLKAGGNAVDAVVAGTLVESLVDPHMFTVGGEVPILVRMAASGKTVVINGNTAAPAAAVPDEYRRRGLEMVPGGGILASGVPAAIGALLTALGQFGTFGFKDVARTALHYARVGFPVHTGLVKQENYGLRDCASIFRDWPHSSNLYLSNGQAPVIGQVLRNSAYADVLQLLIDAENAASGSRITKIDAVYRTFYRGDPASIIAQHSRDADGLLTREDMEVFATHVEDPVWIDFVDTRVYKCGPWNQGPVLLQSLAILAAQDLQKHGHNSAGYVHRVVEAMKLAFADREQYYGDPRLVDVPIEALLSRDYACARAQLIDPARASPELRPGDPRNGLALLPEAERLGGSDWGAGTVHVNAIDRAGNAVAATPSGGWVRSSPIIPELGFPLGNRLMTFCLEPERHPNVIAPFKRPRTTISPSLATRAGQPWLVFGSMGGDMQDQWQLQFFLNRALFDLTLQAAIEAPKFSSEHFPASFGIGGRSPNRLRIERMIGTEVLDQLQSLGHELDPAPDWSEGFLLAIERHGESGVLEAGCDPRGAKSEIFAPGVRVF